MWKLKTAFCMAKSRQPMSKDNWETGTKYMPQRAYNQEFLKIEGKTTKIPVENRKKHSYIPMSLCWYKQTNGSEETLSYNRIPIISEIGWQK